ncbi:winged helix DNA-binding domain-containing protein [Streptomyces sp. NPDC051940]|uniref:winged helix DNA-binding domain-containing protein n=1 Tax=Streptomyces sp. NPDC051940 TaxID=3155675 RepID=UPI00341D9D34
MPPLTQRTLNRTLLQRQFLLARTSAVPPYDVIRRLVAVQAQEHNWPYVGLWTRIEGFAKDDLVRLLADRSVVRATMIRRTVHLAAAEDFRWLRPTVEPVVTAALRTAYFRPHLEGLDLDELVAAGRELLAGRTLPRRELGALLAERFPGRKAAMLQAGYEVLDPLVHPLPAGTWGGWNSRPVAVARAAEFTGTELADGPRFETMILRYLAAFGPATVMDLQSWAGVTRLRPAVEALRPRLRVLYDEDGRELFDHPDAVLADPDLPAPVRLLPAFDNVLQGHRDRARIIAEDDRRRTAKEASAGVPMFLVDGFVRGEWRPVDEDTVRVRAYGPLTAAEEEAVRAEVARLSGLLGGAEPRVRWEQV